MSVAEVTTVQERKRAKNALFCVRFKWGGVWGVYAPRIVRARVLTRQEYKGAVQLKVRFYAGGQLREKWINEVEVRYADR